MRLRQSIRIYSRNKYNPAEFNPDPIWNDGALGFFEEVPQQEQQRRQQQQQQQDE